MSGHQAVNSPWPGGTETLHSSMSQRPVLLRLHPYACTDNVTPEWGWLMVERNDTGVAWNLQDRLISNKCFWGS